MPEFLEVNDSSLEVRRHVYQRRAMMSLALEIIVLKGWQAGYTTMAAWWLYYEMIRCGAGNPTLIYLLLAPVIGKARLVAEVKRLFVDVLKIAKEIKHPYWKLVITEEGDVALWGKVQPERTEIHAYQASEPESFAHVTALAVVMDEITQPLFKWLSWLTAQARVTTSRNRMGADGRPCGRIMAGSTVYRWGNIKAMYFDYCQVLREAMRQVCRADAATRRNFWIRYRRGLIHPVRHFVSFSSDKNPMFGKKQMQERREDTEPSFFQMRYRAKFVKPAGMIFGGWGPRNIIVHSPNFNPTNFPKSFERWCCIDPGKRNFYALFIAYDAERQRSIIYDWYHDTSLSNEDRAKQIVSGEWPGHPRPDYWRIDDCVAGQISEDTVRAELATGGLPAKAPQFKDLWLGINNMASAILLGKLQIFECVCEEFVNQVLGYSRPVDDNGNVEIDKDPEDKETYHLIDLTRYFGTFKFTNLSSGAAVSAAQMPVQAPAMQQVGAATAMLIGGASEGYQDTVHNPAAGLDFVW